LVPLSTIESGSPHYAGKQLVYHIPQSQADEVTLEDLAAMDSQIETQRSDITSCKTQEKQLRLILTTLTSTLSTADLRDSVSKLEKEKIEVLSRLEVLRQGDVKPVEVKEKAKVEKEWKVWKRNVEVRKGFVKEMWGMVSEQLPEGVETREDLWVSYNLSRGGVVVRWLG
jgi:26S proteasome regulatory subunit (ATPase 3-interacting protein)